MDNTTLARTVLDRYGRTFADECGIRGKNTPQPLFRLLCLSLLLATERNSTYGLQASVLLEEAGFNSPDALAAADPEQVMSALSGAKYARRLEQHTDRLQSSARHLLDTYDGDLRGLREAAAGDLDEMRRLVEDFKGIGAVGVQIFLREVQALWPEVRPYADDRARAGAEALGLPTAATELAGLVHGDDFARFVCGLVRVDFAGDAEDVKAAAA